MPEIAPHRQAGRAGRLLLVGVLLPLLAAGLGWLAHQALDPARWPIRAVRIDGDLQRTDHHRLQQRVAPLATTGLLLVDVGRVRAAVEEMPWVERAYVRRLWPDQLRVTVVEQVPLARWSDRERLVNAQGRLFAVPPGEHPPELAVLDGPPGQVTRLAEQYRLMDGLLTRAGRRVARLELDERRAWRMRLDSGLEVELGRGAVRLRLQRLLAVLLNWPADELARAARIDLRYTNGLAIRWRDDPPQVADPGRVNGDGQT